MLPEGGCAAVDVRSGGLRAEAQADDAAGDLLRQLQGGDDMAGLALVAGGAGGDADALLPQVVDDVLAGPAHQGDGEHVGRPAGSGEDLQIGDGGQPLHGVVPDPGHVAELVLQVFQPQLCGLGKAGDLGRGLGAGPEAALLPAAGQQGPGALHAGADVQGADALGPADLVGGDGDKVRPQGLGGAGDL